MSVYFIQAGKSGPIKIGYAGSVASRLTKMQADNHERLIVLADVDGDRAVERQYHKRFVEHHLHGEWFRSAQEILDCIAAFGPQERLQGNLSDRLRRAEDLRRKESLTYTELIDALGGRQALAKRLNGAEGKTVTPVAIDKWHQQNWIPHWAHRWLASFCLRDGVSSRPPEPIENWLLSATEFERRMLSYSAASRSTSSTA